MHEGARASGNACGRRALSRGAVTRVLALVLGLAATWACGKSGDEAKGSQPQPQPPPPPPQATIDAAATAVADPAQVRLLPAGVRWGQTPAEVAAVLGEIPTADGATAKLESAVVEHRRVAELRVGDAVGSAELGFFRQRLAEVRLALPAMGDADARAALTAAGFACDRDCAAGDHRATVLPVDGGGVEVVLASERESAPWRELGRQLRYSREGLRELTKLTKDTVLFDFDDDGDDDVAIVRWPRVDVLVAGQDEFVRQRFVPCPKWSELADESLVGYWVADGRLVLYTSGPGPSGMTFVEVADQAHVAGDGCHSFGCTGMDDEPAPVTIGKHSYSCSFDECLSERGKGSCADPLRRPRPAKNIVDELLGAH